MEIVVEIVVGSVTTPKIVVKIVVGLRRISKIVVGIIVEIVVEIVVTRTLREDCIPILLVAGITRTACDWPQVSQKLDVPVLGCRCRKTP